MGLRPAARAQCGPSLPRCPGSRPKAASKTCISEVKDDYHSAPGCSSEPQSGCPKSQALVLPQAGSLSPLHGPEDAAWNSLLHDFDPPPHSTIKWHSLSCSAPGLEETAGSPALAQLLPRQLPQDTSEDSRSVQQGEKPVADLESIPSQKRVELDPAVKAESEGMLVKQGAVSKARPRPGDLIEIFRIGYEHWAIYVENDCVVHLAPPSDDAEAGSIMSVFSNQAVVKYSRLEDVLHGCSWKVNNKLDGTYLPLPVDKIIRRTKKMINKVVQYNLIEGNCEHFVNNLRYGVSRSQQVEHVLMEGAKAAGAVISAMVDSMRPKAVTA